MILRKTIAALTLLIILSATFFPLNVALAAGEVKITGGSGSAGACAVGSKGCDYVALTTIPGATVGCTPIAGKTEHCQKTDPVKVIKNFYGVAIGIAAVLAVIMIIYAGIEYATIESITGKSDAKDKWQGALIGLGLLLASYLILRTINIDLVNVNLDLGSPIINENSKAGSDVLYGILQSTKNNSAQLSVGQLLIAQKIQSTTVADNNRIDTLKKELDAETDVTKIAAKQQELYEAVRQADINKYSEGAIQNTLKNSPNTEDNKQKAIDSYNIAIADIQDKINKGQIKPENLAASQDKIKKLTEEKDLFINRFNFNQDSNQAILNLDKIKEANGNITQMGIQDSVISQNTNVITQRSTELKQQINNNLTDLLKKIPADSPQRPALENEAKLQTFRVDKYVSDWTTCVSGYKNSKYWNTKTEQITYYNTYCAPYLGK